MLVRLNEHGILAFAFPAYVGYAGNSNRAGSAGWVRQRSLTHAGVQANSSRSVTRISRTSSGCWAAHARVQA